MKTRILFFLCFLLALLAFAGFWLTKPKADSVQIEISSSTYPMTVGMMTLTVHISDANGQPIDDARVQVTTQLKRAGSPAILNFPNQASNGDYQVPITWTMMGQALVTVWAEIPNLAEPVEKQFLVYVYLIPPLNAVPERGFPNLSEINAAMSSNPEREYWIYIPQGATEMLMMSEIYAFVPNEIKLSLSGQNTIVIRNDDFYDHNVGPFFIRAGETIRQEFVNAAVFQGTCTISHGATVRIVVEE